MDVCITLFLEIKEAKKVVHQRGAILIYFRSEQSGIQSQQSSIHIW